MKNEMKRGDKIKKNPYPTPLVNISIFITIKYNIILVKHNKEGAVMNNHPLIPIAYLEVFNFLSSINY